MKRVFLLPALMLMAVLFHGIAAASAEPSSPNPFAKAPDASVVIKVGGYGSGGYDNGYRRYDDADDDAADEQTYRDPKDFSDEKTYRDPKDFSEERTYRDRKDFSDERTYSDRSSREYSYSYKYKRYSGGYDAPRYRDYGGHDYCWSCKERCRDGFCPPRCWGWWRNCRWHRDY